ncbi:MAG: hypothetical protein ACK53Y_19175, partial [bacterium]
TLSHDNYSGQSSGVVEVECCGEECGKATSTRHTKSIDIQPCFVRNPHKIDIFAVSIWEIKVT